jgi:anti-anti-sigma factor
VAPLTFDTALNGGDALVVLAGELDLAGSAALEAEIDRLAGLEEVERVVLDLRRLEFMDSSGLRTVALADRRLRGAERKLALIRGPEVVQRVFDITRMAERLEIAASPEELDLDVEKR